jgi:hypothetical protein
MGSNNSALLQYESLRSQVINRQTDFSERGMGLALFIRRGMLAWMEICQQAIPADTHRPQTPAFAFGVTAQMVKVMANITLFNLEEALS